MQISIDTSAVENFSARLKDLHKSAFPSAVRGTLNRAVFDYKTKSMPASASENFVSRQANFFKANSKFENATGFNMSTMKSTVGFFSNNLSGHNNYAVKDLEQQEHGGSIDHRSFIPLPASRISGNQRKIVRANARLSAIKKIINGKEAKGVNWEQRAIKSAVFAGKEGLLLMPGRKGSVLWKINNLQRKKGNIRFTKTKLYSFTKNRNVKVHATHFSQQAATETQKRMEGFYIIEAKRQIAKFLSK